MQVAPGLAGDSDCVLLGVGAGEGWGHHLCEPSPEAMVPAPGASCEGAQHRVAGIRPGASTQAPEGAELLEARDQPPSTYFLSSPANVCAGKCVFKALTSGRRDCVWSRGASVSRVWEHRTTPGTSWCAVATRGAMPGSVSRWHHGPAKALPPPWPEPCPPWALGGFPRGLERPRNSPGTRVGLCCLQELHASGLPRTP